MRNRCLYLMLGLAMISASNVAWATNCDFLIAQFQQKPMALFVEGRQQCLSGEPDQGATKIQQAITLLQNP